MWSCALRRQHAYLEPPRTEEAKKNCMVDARSAFTGGAPNARGKRPKNPDIDYYACIMCNRCIDVCPEDALYLKEGGFQWPASK